MKASIGIAAEQLGVSKDTLRRWERAGKIAAERTARGHRRYDIAKLLGANRIHGAGVRQRTIAYARVSSHDQKEPGSLKYSRTFAARMDGLMKSSATSVRVSISKNAA